MLDYRTVKQESLVGFELVVKPPKSPKTASKKKAAKPSSGWQGRSYGGGGSFYGVVLPQPRHPDGSPLSCPCGRVYILPNASGAHVLFDSEAPLGAASLASLEPKRAIHHLLAKGCALHVRADRYRLRRVDQPRAL